MPKTLKVLQHAAEQVIDKSRGAYHQLLILVHNFEKSREIIVYVEYRPNNSIAFRFDEMIDTRFPYHWEDPTTHTQHLIESFALLQEKLEQLGCESISPEISAHRPLKPWNTLELRFPAGFRDWDEAIEAVEGFALRYFEKARVDTRNW